MYKIAGIALLISLLVGSCKNDDFSIGSYLSDPHTRSIYIDTVSVKLYTMLMGDSVVTSNRGVIFSGYYNDPEIGKFSSRAYLEFDRTFDTETDKYAVYDSTTLILAPNGSYYGDTTKLASFKVSLLTEEIEPYRTTNKGYLYSTSSLSTGNDIANTTAKVRVGKKENVEIRLDDNFGLNLFNGIYKEETAMNTANFNKTFPGVALEGGAGSGAVHGFVASDTSCFIRVYYHISQGTKVKKTFTFPLNPINQFDQYTIDRLPQFPASSKDDPVPSEQTGHKAVIQSGTTLYTRIEFPHLNNLIALGEIVVIQKAVLVVRPLRNSYDTVPLPMTLNMYEQDPTKNMLSDYIMKDSRGYSLTGNLPSNYRYYDNPSYQFDITSFIQTQMGATGYSKWAINLVTPLEQTTSFLTLERLVFGDQKYFHRSELQSKAYRIELQITCSIYNSSIQ